MAPRKDEIVFSAFLASAVDAGGGLPGAVERFSSEVAGLKLASEAQTEAAGTYSRLLSTSPVYREPAPAKAESPAGDALGNYARVLENSPVYREARGDKEPGVMAAVLRNALGMAPLARLIIGLFGGGESETAPSATKFALPPRMRFEAADGPGTSLLATDYGQDGLARAYAPERAGEAGPQVTIQVQAMDSRSFLDHKEEIARAVREAMLNSHSLNDVVSEL